MDLRELVALSLIPLVGTVRSSSSSAPGLRARLAEAIRAIDPADPPPAGALLRYFACAAHDSGAARTRVAELETAADRALQSARAGGIRAIPLDDERYPARLKTIPDPPLVIWTRATSSFSPPAVAIVGSRAASPYALEMAEHLGTELAARGVIVVSGLARGVDSAAHHGALLAGATIAVLGSGADIIYPPEHQALADEIVQCGGLVSELPPGTPPRAHHFPLRNRLISGLSLAVVVIEASERSGSLITAACALEQGREVMAVPGNALSGRNRGAHALLRDGAKIVETADDILEELPGVGRLTDLPGSETRLNERGSGPDLEADRILACFQPGDACGVDDLSRLTGLDAGRILARLAQWELAGVVRRLSGGRFALARPC